MPCGIRWFAVFALSAHILYLLPQLFYVALGGMVISGVVLTNTQWAILYTVPAALYFVDGFLYLFALWAEEGGVKCHLSLFSESLNFVGNTLFLVSAGLLFWPIQFIDQLLQSDVLKPGIIIAIVVDWMIQSAFQWGACLVFFLDALLYNAVYFNKLRKSPKTCRQIALDPYFWVEAFNLIPSLGYFVGATTLLFIFLRYTSTVTDVSSAQATFWSAYLQFNVWALAFNIMYTMDAAFFVVGWVKDFREGAFSYENKESEIEKSIQSFSMNSLRRRKRLRFKYDDERKVKIIENPQN